MQSKNTVKFSSETEKKAITFLIQQKADMESVSISSAKMWVSATISERIIGVVGVDFTKNTARIKALFVHKKHRNEGVAHGLLDFIFKDDPVIKILLSKKEKVTAFATPSSKPIFELYGLNQVWVNKNNISFMEKQSEITSL